MQTKIWIIWLMSCFHSLHPHICHLVWLNSLWSHFQLPTLQQLKSCQSVLQKRQRFLGDKCIRLFFGCSSGRFRWAIHGQILSMSPLMVLSNCLSRVFIVVKWLSVLAHPSCSESFETMKAFFYVLVLLVALVTWKYVVKLYMRFWWKHSHTYVHWIGPYSWRTIGFVSCFRYFIPLSSYESET